MPFWWLFDVGLAIIGVIWFILAQLEGTFYSIILTVIPSFIIVAAAAYLEDKYTKNREYEERVRKRREANALVTDILAAWVHPTFDPNANIRDQNQFIYEMQTVYWKSALWIDDDLLIELNKRLTNQPDALSTNALIALARKYVQELEESDITERDIIDWSHLIKSGDK